MYVSFTSGYAGSAGHSLLDTAAQECLTLGSVTKDGEAYSGKYFSAPFNTFAEYTVEFTPLYNNSSGVWSNVIYFVYGEGSSTWYHYPIEIKDISLVRLDVADDGSTSVADGTEWVTDAGAIVGTTTNGALMPTVTNVPAEYYAADNGTAAPIAYNDATLVAGDYTITGDFRAKDSSKKLDDGTFDQFCTADSSAAFEVKLGEETIAENTLTLEWTNKTYSFTLSEDNTYTLNDLAFALAGGRTLEFANVEVTINMGDIDQIAADKVIAAINAIGEVTLDSGNAIAAAEAAYDALTTDQKALVTNYEIAAYIKNQLQEDLAYEQMSIKELIDPFTGEQVHSSKK